MNLPSASFGQVLLLLRRRAVPDDGQRADAGVRGEGDGEAALLGDVVGDDGGGHLVHLEAAVLLGDVDGGEAEVGGLLDEAAGDGEVLGLDLVGRGDDLVGGEVGGGLGDLALLFGEVFGEEAVGGGGVGDEEAAAGDDLLVGGSGGGHCGHGVTSFETSRFLEFSSWQLHRSLQMASIRQCCLHLPAKIWL